jgi:hypothetical protein
MKTYVSRFVFVMLTISIGNTIQSSKLLSFPTSSTPCDDYKFLTLISMRIKTQHNSNFFMSTLYTHVLS